MSYRPGHTVACCSGNVHRMFPNYAIRMWMSNAQGGLAAVLYGPSRMKASVDGHAIKIHEETDYPFGEEIHFSVHSETVVALPLSLRIPGWCSAPRFYQNEKPLPQPPIDKGFARLNRKFHPGDKITLVLPMKAAVSRWPDNGVGVEHGPLVYSLPIKEDWTSLVIPKYSTDEFPCWNAVPGSAWNYGLATDEAKLTSEIQIQRKRMTEDPWVEPPISATVTLRKIAGSELETDPQDANQKFTPALPELAKMSVANESERMNLVPYGSTHLRLTIFPDLDVSDASAKIPKTSLVLFK